MEKKYPFDDSNCRRRSRVATGIPTACPRNDPGHGLPPACRPGRSAVGWRAVLWTGYEAYDL